MLSTRRYFSNKNSEINYEIVTKIRGNDIEIVGLRNTFLSEELIVLPLHISAITSSILGFETCIAVVLKNQKKVLKNDIVIRTNLAPSLKFHTEASGTTVSIDL